MHKFQTLLPLIPRKFWSLIPWKPNLASNQIHWLVRVLKKRQQADNLKFNRTKFLRGFTAYFVELEFLSPAQGVGHSFGGQEYLEDTNQLK